MLKSGISVSIRSLSLSSGNLFYEDSGHRIPSRVGVKVWTVARASTNPESHAHLSFVDVVTVAFDRCLPSKHSERAQPFLFVQVKGRSLINKRKRTGPIIEPLETPDLNTSESDKVPAMLTHCRRSDR